MGNIRLPAPGKGQDSPAWKYLMEGPALRAKFARTHDKALGQPVTTIVGRISTHHYLHHSTTLNSHEETEELRKVPIRKYILEKISLRGGGKSWMNGSGI